MHTHSEKQKPHFAWLSNQIWDNFYGVDHQCRWANCLL